MSLASLPLLAQDAIHYRLQWGRIHSKLDLILAVAVCAGLVAFVWAMYRRDARELGRVWGWLLAAMRSAVFVALLIIFLQHGDLAHGVVEPHHHHVVGVAKSLDEIALGQRRGNLALAA